MRPDGLPIWTSAAMPGHLHDTRCARELGLTAALNRSAAELDLPTLAESGYESTGHGIKTPVKQPADGICLAPDNRARNRLLCGPRWRGERGLPILIGRWKTPGHTTISPRRAGDIVAGALHLPPSDTNTHHQVAEINSLERGSVKTLKRSPDRPRGVVSSVASDAHTWNLVYLQLLLEEHGYSVRNLGACVPVEDLVAGCLMERPQLLVLSTVNGHGLIEAPSYIRRVRERAELHGLVVVIGGKLNVGGTVADDDVRRLLHLGFDGVFTTVDSVQEFRRFLTHTGKAAAGE
ncbi:cobalamin-dependent protein [Actinoplanes sp. NPDC026623]|uniref:cobalamin-dependent protein n=1 Tax=Actinoplanes sp. NPDC026623 TaxID=3155610 RepID=UPI0033C4D6EC